MEVGRKEGKGSLYYLMTFLKKKFKIKNQKIKKLANKLIFYQFCNIYYSNFSFKKIIKF